MFCRLPPSVGRFCLLPSRNIRLFCTSTEKDWSALASITVNENVYENWYQAIRLVRSGNLRLAVLAANLFVTDLPHHEGFFKLPLDDAKLRELAAKPHPLLGVPVTLGELCDPKLIYRPHEKSVILDLDDADAVMSSFKQAKFQNPSSVRKLFEELQAHARQWTSSCRFYAPYTALVNASMTGKSRLLSELRHEGVFLFYMCFRASQTRGYWPPRTPLIADWATQENSDLLDYTAQTCTLLEVCLEELCNWLPTQPSQPPGTPEKIVLKTLTSAWYDYVEDDPNRFWAPVSSRVQTARCPDGIRKSATTDVRKAHDVAAHWRSSITALTVKLRGLLENRGISYSDKDANKDKLQLLFVVDETKELNEASGNRDRFAWFRRALTALPYASSNPAVFCVMTDTTSRVANLVPLKALDPSWRVRDPLENKDLFQPCSVFDSLDVWWRAVNRLGDGVCSQWVSSGGDLVGTLGWIRREVNIENSGQGFLKYRIPLELLESFEFLSMFGRPAFYAFLHKRGPPSDEYAAAALVNLLKVKLLRQDPKDDPAASQKRMYPDDEVHAAANTHSDIKGVEKASSFTQIQALAVLGSIASIDVSVASKLAAELSAGHMRLLGAISDQRQFVFTLSVSEPPLAFAAHSLILSGTMPWFVLMDKLSSTFVNNCVLSGYQGEVAAQILWLMAWQKCAKWSPISFAFVPAGDFLDTIVGGVIRTRTQQLRNRLKELGVSEESVVSLRIRNRGHFALGLKGSERKEARSLCDELVELEKEREEWDKIHALMNTGLVRVFQFVKTLASGGATLKMLVDHMIRGSAIMCRDGQKGIDFIVPVKFGWETMAILSQVKLYKRRLEPTEINIIRGRLWEAWRSMYIDTSVAPESQKPVVGVILALDPTGKNAKSVTCYDEGDLRFTIVVRGLSPVDIFPEDRLAQLAFEKLVLTDSDPASNLHVLTTNYQQVKNVFSTQPYSINGKDE